MFFTATLVGILTEWVTVFIIAKLTDWPDRVLPALVLITLTVMSISFWRDQKLGWPSSPKGCLKSLVLVPAIGALVFCGDMILGQLLHPLTNPINAALNTGAFGGALTVGATAFGEVFALGSLARSIVLRINERRSS